MTIRLTSPQAFDKVIERLKNHQFYDAETNELFINHGVPMIKEGIAKGDDEWYLEVEFPMDYNKCLPILRMRYTKRSEIMTDEEYLNEEENENE